MTSIETLIQQYPNIVEIIKLDRSIEDLNELMISETDIQTKIQIIRTKQEVQIQRNKYSFLRGKEINDVITDTSPYAVGIFSFMAEHQPQDLIKILKEYYCNNILNSYSPGASNGE